MNIQSGFHYSLVLSVLLKPIRVPVLEDMSLVIALLRLLTKLLLGYTDTQTFLALPDVGCSNSVRIFIF